METSTPMLQQYQAVKAKHKDCILFFRLGDFYEMFYGDAKVASHILDLVLTSRGRGTPLEVPMCGLPYHAADTYIAKLIKAGYKVAICEQMEDPALAKGIVRRDVIRIITSGTFLGENTAEARYLLSLSPDSKTIGVAFIDSATGTIQTNQYSNQSKTIELITRLPISECIFPMSMKGSVEQILKHPLLKTKSMILSPHDDWCFNPDIARKTLCEHFAIHNLHGFGIEELPSAISSTGALLEYLKQMNKQPLRHIDKISLYADDDYVFISPAATHGLELETLLKTIDHTLTAMGKRKLRYWLYHPLKSPAAISERQKAVSLLNDTPMILKKLREILRIIPDIEKSISRLSCGYTNVKDILAIRNALSSFPEIQNTIHPLITQNPLFQLEDIPVLRNLLERAINAEIPLSNHEGKVVKKGFHSELDSLREIQENGHQWLKNFQEQEIRRTHINSLKVGFNKVFGYYIEISNANLKSAPADYMRKQTLVNGERFITQQLKEYEEKILTAQDKIIKIENEIVQKIQTEILNHSIDLHNFSQAIATLDVIYSLSILAQSLKYIIPEVAEDTIIDIKEGRHPVVEKTSAEAFVPNDTILDCEENHLIVLTGPNMAGKSTYIRQTAVLVILAQMGSYIPATKAHIGIVDKIFTRIGAHDDIAKGQSTFMVEMNEAADILNNLSERSLIILDEIGRGTSTYDGLSLAWALAEYLQKTKARTLFATHFHELTALADEYRGVKNYNVAVKEWKDEIIFLHKIIPGSTDDSYGIYVAKLAGIPKPVIDRSRQILTQLELKNNLRETIKGNTLKEDQLNFFSSQKDPIVEKVKSVIESMDVNNLTPLAALNKLQELKEMMEGNNADDR